MADEKIVIEIVDRVAPSIVTKIEEIAIASRDAYSYVQQLTTALANINSSANVINAMSTAQARMQASLNASALSAQRLATQQQRTAQASAQAASAQARLGAAQSQAATAGQRLATAQQQTAAATSRAATASNAAAISALRLQQAQNRAAAATGSATTALGGYVRQALAIAISVRTAQAILETADAYTTLQNKLVNVAGSQQRVNELTKEIFELAIRTRSPVDDTASAFVRFDRALAILGKSQSETIRLTETVNKALIVSGATVTETGSSLLQLSQAFNKGKLNGDEFRSLAENMPIVLDAIAKATGKPIQQIQQMSTEGKITASVLIAAFKAIQQEIDDKFGKTVPTVSQAFGNLKTAVTEVLGEFNKGIGFTRDLAVAIEFVSKNLSTAITYVRIFFDLISTVKDFGVSTAIEMLAQFWDSIKRAYQELVNFFKNTANAALEAANFLREKVGLKPFELLNIDPVDSARQFKGLGKLWAESVTKGFADVIKDPVDFVTVDARRVKAENLPGGGGKVRVPKKRSVNESIVNQSKEYIDGLKILVAYNKELDDQIKLMGMLPAEREREQSLVNIQNQLYEKDVVLREDQIRTIREKLLLQQQANLMAQAENDLLNNSVTARDSFIIQLEAINKLLADQSSGFTKGDAATATNGILQSMGLDTTNFQTQADSLVSVYANMMAQIKELQDAGLLNEQDAAGARAQIWAKQQASQLDTASNFFTQLSQLSKSENKKIAAIGKAAAITGAIIDTYKAATGAYASLASIPYVGPVLGAAAAAAAIVAGMANVNAIRNQNAGFMAGGYTGNMPITEVAGNVHGKEYVMDAKSTARIGVKNLDAMRKGGAAAAQMKVTINNYGTSKSFETKQVSPDEIRIIARDEASKQIQKTTPDLVASEIKSPNSKVSKALNTSTTVGRRR